MDRTCCSRTSHRGLLGLRSGTFWRPSQHLKLFLNHVCSVAGHIILLKEDSLPSGDTVSMKQQCYIGGRWNIHMNAWAKGFPAKHFPAATQCLRRLAFFQWRTSSQGKRRTRTHWSSTLTGLAWAL